MTYLLPCACACYTAQIGCEVGCELLLVGSNDAGHPQRARGHRNAAVHLCFAGCGPSVSGDELTKLQLSYEQDMLWLGCTNGASRALHTIHDLHPINRRCSACYITRFRFFAIHYCSSRGLDCTLAPKQSEQQQHPLAESICAACCHPQSETQVSVVILIFRFSPGCWGSGQNVTPARPLPRACAAAAKSRAAAAAAVAAVTVTPGQRDRAIQQAVLAAQQQQEKEQAAAEAAAAAGNGSNGEAAAAAGGDSNGAGSSPQPPQPPRAAGTYEPPEWSGVPEG